jgi:hypothetical protein
MFEVYLIKLFLFVTFKAAQGTGLAFIVMADVFTKLPGAPFW